MNLTQDQKIDFIKKAAFIADSSTCNYKIGCVGVTDFKTAGVTKENINTLQKYEPNIKYKNGVLYIKTWNETLPGEIYCQTCDKNGNKECIRQNENLKGKEFEKVCSIHAEQNLISKCAKYGIKTNGMILFLTNTPCYICAKSIVQSGIKEIYYLNEHTENHGLTTILKNISMEKYSWN